MAHITTVPIRSVYKRETPLQPGSSEPSIDIAILIEDTITMIENTRSFLNRLDLAQVASRAAMARSCQRLEDALESLKRRQRALAGYDC